MKALHHLPPSSPRQAGELSLGPARVVGMSGATPLVEVDGRRVRAELALAFPYVPRVGDELLVVGKADRHYVIGVLGGQGEVALRFMGDVSLHAVGGRLQLNGDKGVGLRGDNIEMVAGTIKRLATKLVDKADNVFQRVRETLDTHAGNRRDLVDGEVATRADRVSTVTRGVVSINGKEVHMN